MKKISFLLFIVVMSSYSCKKEEPAAQQQSNNQPNNMAYSYIVGKRLRRDLSESIQLSNVINTYPDGVTTVQIGDNGEWDGYPTDYSQNDKIIADFSGGTGNPVTYLIEHVNSQKLVIYQAFSSTNGSRYTYTILP